MYAVDQSVEDVEKGQSVRWNGQTHTVTDVTDDVVVVDGQFIDHEKFTKWLQHESIPFEIVGAHTV